MKIDTFLTLDAVLRGGTLAAAASEMNLTPSAVSMQMKHLEAYLGQPLFDRSGLQVKPMGLAHDVSTAMRDGLQQLEALRKRASVATQGTVRLGVIESMQPVVVPGTMRILRDRYPLLTLRPRAGRSTALTSLVKAGDLDAALVAQPENGGSARLRWHSMLRRELVLIAPPTASEGSVAALFKQFEWIRYDRETVVGSLAARFVNTQKLEKRSNLEFDSAPAIIAMVSAGLGISVLHIADPGLLQAYPVRMIKLGRGAPSIQLSFVTRKADEESRPLEAVRGAMLSTLMTAQRHRITNGI